MIRKGTWIVLGVFAALLVLAYYLQQNPLPEGTSATTPSTTPEPLLLEGWQSGDITYIELTGETGVTSLTKNADGSWILGPENNQPASIDQVENVATQLALVRLMSVLDTTSPLDALGLITPANILTLRNTQGQEIAIKIGTKTPTGSGYYVQVGSSAPSIVSSSQMDFILGALVTEQLAAATPTADVTSAVDKTPTGDATATP